MTKKFAQAGGLLLLALLYACSSDDAADRSENSVSSDQIGWLQSVIRNFPDPTREQLAALQSPASHRAFIHIEAPFEMWHVFGFSDNGPGQRLAHSTRISRLRVRDDNLESSDSLWDFNDVMGLESDIVQIESAKQHAKRQIERSALELAGTDTNAGKVWVGSSVIESVSGSKGSSQANQEEDSCAMQYRLDLQMVDASPFHLDVQQLNCPELAVLRSVVQSSAGSLQSTLANALNDEKSNGRAWVVQAWGWPVDNQNAAVVFDRAWLVLDNELEVQLQQTKRRSGKGPKTTTGTLWSIDSDASTLIENEMALQWRSEIHDKAIQWHISNSSHGIDIIVEQIIETDLSSDRRWFGPVKISGSHQGLGFMDYQPL